MPRRFLFTLPNPSQLDIAGILAFCQNDQFRFLIYQGEISPSGLYHLQGYVEITKSQRVSWFQTNFSDKAHFEAANGSSEKNIHYCSKPVILDKNTPCGCDHCVKARAGQPNWLPVTQFGQPAQDLLGNGMWESVQNMIVAGADNRTITETLPATIPHLQKIDQFRKMRDRAIISNKEIKDPQHEWRPMRVIWLHGASGAGKTQAIWSVFPNVYTCSESNPFDEYAGQKEVLWDDFDPKKISFKTLLRYLDKYPIQLTCRYTNQWALYTDCFITHIEPAYSLYHKKSIADLTQLLRRIEHVKVAVYCGICNAEMIYQNKEWLCGMHGKNTQALRKFFWNKQKFDSLQDLLNQIPYRK